MPGGFASPPDSTVVTKGRDASEIVVIVDDDDDTREAIRTLLDEDGYRTIEARDGREALALLREARVRPALVLLDLMMPTMDGLTLRTRMRADPELAAIPIVVMTAHSAMQRALVNAEPDALVLPKPLDLDRLLQVVARYSSAKK